MRTIWGAVALSVGLVTAILVLRGCKKFVDVPGTRDYAAYTAQSMTIGYYAEEKYDEVKDNLRRQGLMGEHELQSFQLKQSLHGNVLGSYSSYFFLGTGNLKGSISSGESIRFTWRCEGAGLISSIPITKVLVVTDDTKKVPTICFKFDLRQIIESGVSSDNPNDYLHPDLLRSVTIRISRDQQGKEPYLPAAG